VIRTADVLRFVKGPVPSVKAKLSYEPKHARGSSHHSCAKTNASTCDMAVSIYTPNRTSRRQEFEMIKSHEKEALYLSDRFGGRATHEMKPL